MLRASSFGGTVTVPVSLQVDFSSAPYSHISPIYWKKPWKSVVLRDLVSMPGGKALGSPHLSRQRFLLVVGASHPSLEGGMCGWGCGGEVELSCTVCRTGSVFELAGPAFTFLGSCDESKRFNRTM